MNFIRTASLLFAFCSSLFLFPGWAKAQSAYLEQNGLVVIEPENVAALNGWEISNAISGATGPGYIHWTGSQFFNQTGNGVLRYYVNISTVGTYRFEWRVAVGFGTNGTEHNDSWLKIGAGNFYGEKTNSRVKPKPACNNDPDYNCPAGSSLNGFFKIYGGGVNQFQWAARTSDNDAHNVFATFDAPGVYEIEVNARSSYHSIDRLVMYHSSVTGNTARALSNPESPQENVTTGVAELTGELKTWHDVQLTFDGPATSEEASPNPFADYRLDVTFTNGEKSYVVPGYYAADGNAAETSATAGNKWRVHFAPDTVGDWSWSAAFTTGNDVAVNEGGTPAGFFDGATGSFTVTATDKTGRDHRGKGRLQYVGQHYLQYAETGEWFVKAGADAPENTLAYEDFDEVPNQGNRRKTWQPHQQDYLAAEAAPYTWQNGKGSELLGVVNYLSTVGVNAFSFLTFNTQGDDNNVFPHLLIAGQNYGGNNSWQELHHDRFDVSRTAQWERIFSYADVKGMYLHFKLQETENDQLMDGGNVGRERKLYYRELIARFSHHLALNWNMGEENTQTTQQRKDMAAYFAQTDPYNHLRVLHTYPGQKDQVYTPLLDTASQYTGLSLQTSSNAQSQNFGDTKTWVEKSANAGKKWVVAVDEPGSANIGVDSDPRDRKLTRHRVVWANFMAGGAGTEFYYGYQSGCGDLECQDHRSREEKYTDAAIALRFFQTYFQAYLPNVINDDELTSANDDWVLNANNQAYAVYLPDGGSTDITLPTTGGDTVWQVRWYNPRDGSLSGPIDITNSITAPDNNDWAALIEINACILGTACDDGDSCTTNDLIDADCNCVGTFADADADTVCDAEDQCPGENDLADADNDDVPDTCDDCDNRTSGMPCDDSNPDTTNDVIDVNCNCVGTPVPGANDYWLEAECSTFGSGWTEVADPAASNGSYLTPTGNDIFTANVSASEEYRVTFRVAVVNPGTYNIFARVRTTADADDSFWVRTGCSSTWTRWNKVGFDYGYTGYVWEQVAQWESGDNVSPVSFELTAGVNVIEFAVREPGIQLDRIIITPNSAAPTTMGAAALNCSTACTPGTPCDDGDAATFNDSWDDGCNCAGSSETTDCLGITALPVTLTDFSGRAEKTTAILNWSTATENGADRFIVERSLDGRSFHQIGEVGAAGNTTATTNYDFKDESTTASRHYYRLRMVDLDRAETFSRIITLDFVDNFSVWPNPASDIIHLAFGQEATRRVVLVDLLGRHVRSKEVTGTNNTLSVIGLPRGVYLLMVEGAKEPRVKRVVLE
ncbi:DUF5060 domain-containing protein [Neolewinella persica]|uniref:DUF5060 domain-containing protein n=1 Tax=Neolewinella persica TaxID=70998 RepID=UPI0003737020|nr:DUF5060 domain-containing protein [Neolewinella persica]